MTIRRIEGPAGELHVDDGGNGGVPVVFVHSFAGSSAHWAAQLAHLRGSRRAVALDLRGHGASAPPPDDDYAVASLAADVAAVLNALDLPRVELVGHSIGASATIAYAGTHPERVSGLLLVGAPGRTPAEQAQQILRAMKADYTKVTQEYWSKLLAGAETRVRAQITAEMNSLSKDAALAIIEGAFAYDPVPDLERFAGPTLSVMTAHGEGPNDLQHALPHLPHRRIEGTSHWPHMDRPNEFNDLLDEFLARTSDVDSVATDRR